MAPLIPSLGTRRSWVVYFAPRPLYPREKNHVTDWIGGRVGFWRTEKSLTLLALYCFKLLQWSNVHLTYVYLTTLSAGWSVGSGLERIWEVTDVEGNHGNVVSQREDWLSAEDTQPTDFIAELRLKSALNATFRFLTAQLVRMCRRVVQWQVSDVSMDSCLAHLTLEDEGTTKRRERLVQRHRVSAQRTRIHRGYMIRVLQTGVAQSVQWRAEKLRLRRPSQAKTGGPADGLSSTPSTNDQDLMEPHVYSSLLLRTEARLSFPHWCRDCRFTC